MSPMLDPTSQHHGGLGAHQNTVWPCHHFMGMVPECPRGRPEVSLTGVAGEILLPPPRTTATRHDHHAEDIRAGCLVSAGCLECVGKTSRGWTLKAGDRQSRLLAANTACWERERWAQA
jgi:hypothetical protein